MAARMATATSTASTKLRLPGLWCLALSLISLLALATSAFATEPLKPVLPPQNAIAVGGVGELRDDVYSADLKWSVELAPYNCLSFYTDMSYRFVSYEWQTMLHDQIHELVNLRVNGLNESYVGMKFFPLDSGGLFLFGNPYALIGSLLTIPVMLYAFGFFEKERSYGEKLGAVAMAMTAFVLSLFLLDFIFRLMQDFTYVQTYQVR